MKGKLIKMVEGYTLSLTGNIDDLYAISNHQLAVDHQLYKLSLKNCQAIENGYDLDELFESIPIGPTDENGRWKLRAGFITGFQKALEILGDKKFSEEDILIIRNKFVDILPIGDVSTWNMIKACKDFTSWFDNYIQSLQQTEWDVQIEMIGPLVYTDDLPKDGEERPTYKPKLDSDGNLILKI